MRTVSIFSSLAQRIAGARNRARVARALDTMSDHDLRDIGLTRAEIDLIASGKIRHGVR